MSNMSAFRAMALILAIAVITPFTDAVEAAPRGGHPVSAEAIERAVAERADWGLPADPQLVADMFASGRDVGSARWGIPMTAEEEAQLDLAGRMAFASEVKRAVVPYVESLPTSGGVYIDQARNGSLVVLLTEENAFAESEIARRMPAGERGFRVEHVTHTEAQLRQALTRARRVWGETVPDVPLLSAALDVMNNRVLFYVEPHEVAGGEKFTAALVAALDVPVGVAGRPREDSHDVVCTGRDNCHTPTKAGVRLYRGAISSTPYCTMAFHVVTDGGGVDFVTAGHCGYGGSNNWYIKDGTSNGLLMGAEVRTLYKQGGQDIMRVDLPSNQKSHKIIGETRVYGGSGACPLAGQAACASRGKSDVVDCGTVSVTWMDWVSNTAGYTVWGGDLANVTAESGDSGSPVFDRLTSELWGTVGVLNTAGGLFAVLCKAESGLNITGLAY